MSLAAKPIQKYAAADNSEHPTAKAAVDHNKFLLRTANLELALNATNAVSDVGISIDDHEHRCVYLGDLPKFIAANANLILVALDVTQRRGPRTPKPVVKNASNAG